MHTHRSVRRRAAILALGAVAALGTACTTPTITDGNPGGGGGNGAGPAFRVRFTGQPSAVLKNQVMRPSIRVVVADSELRAVTSSTAEITLTLIGTGSATLGGTFDKNAVSGTALFSDLTFDTTGTYRLIASAGGLVSDTSDSFVVGVPLTDTVIVDVGSTAADSASQVTFRSERNLSHPAVDTIAQGGVVHWRWKGNIAHGVLFDDLTYASGIFTAPKDLFLRMNTQGTFTYQCAVHGAAMTGSVLVQ